MGLLDEWQWALWAMWDADPGQGGTETLDKEIEPNPDITGWVGGTQPHPHLQEQGRMLLELLASGLLSPFPLPL